MGASYKWGYLCNPHVMVLEQWLWNIYVIYRSWPSTSAGVISSMQGARAQCILGNSYNAKWIIILTSSTWIYNFQPPTYKQYSQIVIIAPWEAWWCNLNNYNHALPNIIHCDYKNSINLTYTNCKWWQQHHYEWRASPVNLVAWYFGRPFDGLRWHGIVSRQS